MTTSTSDSTETTAPVHSNIRSQLRKETSPELHKKIRRLWIEHSIAEDARNIPGLIATLTPDCVYEVVQAGVKWEGHDGAARFYTELLTAFPDIHFDLQHIVIGPQGVWEEAHVTGTHLGKWLDMDATGQAVKFDVTILFPWDTERELFTGERVHFFGLNLSNG
jgi:predicted ester cyclase